MKTVNYARAKLVKAVVGAPLLAVAGFVCLPFVGTFVGVIVLMGGVALLGHAALGARKLFGDPAALRYDRDRLTISTMWSESTVRWSDVAEVGTSALNTYAFYGLIKVGSTKYLDVRMQGGFFAKKYRLLSGMLDLDRHGVAALVEDLALHRIAAARNPAQRIELTPEWSAPQAEAAFDPDAALANYMRRSRMAEAPEPAPVAPGFGRRDSLEGAPQPPLSGSRPGGFGRKGL